MARHKFLKRLLYTRSLYSLRITGFTLIELLVAILIGSLITFLLMGLVIDLAEANQRDSSKSQVQQDMQMAIDYMAQDLREAVFVYNGQCLSTGETAASGFRCPRLIDHLPADLSSNGRTPVLAFWRTDPLPVGIAAFCGTNAQSLRDRTPNPADPISGVCLSGRTYSLIVYVLDTDVANQWGGEAQVRRFRLARFRDNATDATGTIPGYVDPLRDPSLTFQQWPLSKNNVSEQAARPNLTDSPAPVLLDFVSREGAFTQAPSCAGFVDPVQPPNPAPDPAKALSPTGATNPSFYVCVRGGGLDAVAGQNQDVLLSVTGNLSGKPGYSRVGPKVDPIQTRVLVRGVLSK